MATSGCLLVAVLMDLLSPFRASVAVAAGKQATAAPDLEHMHLTGMQPEWQKVCRHQAASTVHLRGIMVSSCCLKHLFGEQPGSGSAATDQLLRT